jgi:DNA-binding NarL/FixJ family response regulator
MDETSRPATPVPSETIAVTAGRIQPSPPNVSVWLVDDNDRFRTLVAEMLGRRDGIQCARQFSSPDALLSALASKPGPDVILLDVQMGDRNGLDAVRPIKSLARSTRVLMYTTCYDQEWRERALEDGASDYLLKTDPVDKVIERIRCPAGDPNLNAYPRRRSKRAAESTTPKLHANAITNESVRSLSRTLKLLRSLWN